jgi:hypothetical protein
MPTILRRRPLHVRARRFLPGSSGAPPSGHRVVIQGLGSLLLLAQGYASATAPTVTFGLITQGLGTDGLITQGYAPAVVVPPVVTQGLGTGLLITQGYGAP